MIATLKRLWRDSRGNALIMAGAALPCLIGAAGLATDTIHWATWKRELQRAADSAAYAGVYARVQDNANMTAEQAVNSDLSKHNTTGINLLAGYPQIAYPNGAGYTDAVRVTLAVQKELSFSSFFMSTPPTITVSGTAALFDNGNYCVFARATTGPALVIQGSTNVNMGCGAISNSTDGINSVDVNGTGHSFVATPVAAVGAIDGSLNGSSDLRPYSMPMEDPYTGIPTAVPAGMTCTNYNHATKTNADGSKRPGCYNNFNPAAGTVLSPGTYYLNSTNLSLAGHQSITGTGVTIIFTGSNPGSVSMNGNSAINITAPTTGTYANMALIQSPNATVGNDSTINGDNNTAIDGVIYFPNGDLTFSGSSAGSTRCAMIIGWTVTFSGNANIQNDTTGCVANTQISGRKIRLIA